MSGNIRDPLFDLYCMAYLPTSVITRDRPRSAPGNAQYDMPRPRRSRHTYRLAFAIVAIAATVALISAAHLPL